MRVQGVKPIVADKHSSCLGIKRSLNISVRCISVSSRSCRRDTEATGVQNKTTLQQVSKSIAWKQGAAALVAAVVVSLCGPTPSIAAVQTVPPQEATSFAKSLQPQPVNKGKIWLIFLAGATGLFGAAVALEKNSTLFPAIAKANQALAATKAAQKKKAVEDEKFEEAQATEARTEDAVLQGLKDARSRLQQDASSSQAEPAPERLHKEDVGIDGSSDYQNGAQLNDAEFEVEERQKDVVDSTAGGG